MTQKFFFFSVFIVSIVGAVLLYTAMGSSQQRSAPTRDVVEEAQTPRQVPTKRPEQQKSSHDQSDIFGGASALPSSPILRTNRIKGRCWDSTLLAIH